MKNIFLYAHGGSGNHGCEAIVRTTLQLLNDIGDSFLISSKPDEDAKYGISKICTVIKDTSKINKHSFDFAKAYYLLRTKNDYVPMEKLRYKDAFSRIRKGDLALSVGGDNYCYADVKKYLMLHQMTKERGAKTILWGCSVDPAVIERPEIANDLSQYDLITARESLSYEALKKVNSKTVLVSDTAFWLPMKETSIPDGFVPGNTMGINISPLVINDETTKGIVSDNYHCLIENVLKKTDMSIALIPHVVWEDNDDRTPLLELFEQYKNTKRVCFVDDQNCMQLKYLISKCRFFVGARTHATIAAYSSLVPTLVLGYSIKSKGIARDLFGDESQYVVSVKDLKNRTDISESFMRLLENEESAKALLSKKMSEKEFDKKLIRQALLGL